MLGGQQASCQNFCWATARIPLQLDKLISPGPALQRGFDVADLPRMKLVKQDVASIEASMVALLAG